LWSWQETIKAVFLNRVNILSEYEDIVHSPSYEIKLPSVISLKEYVQSVTSQYPTLVKIMSYLDEEEPLVDDSNSEFPRHLSRAEIEKLLEDKSSNVKNVIFRVKRDYYAEATVSTGKSFVFIPSGKIYSNRAVHGDEVAVEILPKS
jgi:exoribonuclease R